jgi:hypothetical protein
VDHKIRRLDDKRYAGNQFNYYCDSCTLHLHGYNNKHYVESLAGWTWELIRENTGDVVANAGNENVQSFGRTEEIARRDGIDRFNAEPCRKPK